MKIKVITESNILYGEVQSVIKQLAGTYEVSLSSSLDDVVCAINDRNTDLMLIDTGFKAADFIALTRMIRNRSPRTGMIIIADDESYALQAYEVHATGYIIKPVRKSRLKEEIEYCVDQLPVTQKDPAAIQVMTDGGFEIFLNGEPARFKYSKTKKLLAHIISKRGAMVRNSELIKTLWGKDKKDLTERELKARNSYLRNIEVDLQKVFAEAGCEDALIKHWGEIAIAMDKIELIK